jgi:hypothetical protein
MATSNVDTYDPKTKRYTTNETVYLNTTKTWQYFAETMNSVGVKPMPALWAVPSIRATQAFVEMGLFEEPLYCELILTEDWLLSGHPGTVKAWKLCRFPSGQAQMALVGHVRGRQSASHRHAAIERGAVFRWVRGYAYPELELQPTPASLRASPKSPARWDANRHPSRGRDGCWDFIDEMKNEE